ncbi:hypothetical protein [Coleofasciculus sp. A1-SPW-01]|uniref:hypothetical protein n=1 Tax=Coleofasciculus sp. A1-SPW-01 TaxID=3070819 RepID=UPI004062CD4F
MGSWEYNFPAEEVLKLESEIKRIRINRRHIEGLWQEVILNIKSSSLRALLRMHCNLIFFDGKVACIEVTSKHLLKLTESKLLNIQSAFKNVCHSDIQVNFKVATPDKE